MMAIGISGFLAGASGSVYALQIGFVTIEQVFGLTVPLFVIVGLPTPATWAFIVPDLSSVAGFPAGWPIIAVPSGGRVTASDAPW
jgi:hypothetical protein